MTWLPGSDGAATPLEALLGHRPDLLERYGEFYVSLWRGGLVPPRTLELCRLRIAAIHDCAAEWCLRDPSVELSEAAEQALQRGDFAGFAPEERAALALAELTPFNHAAIDDEQVAAVAAVLQPPGTVTLLTALSFFDVVCRMKLVFRLSAVAATLDQPPTAGGALI
jgi:alkylhydroperoxidase family enzyme